MTDTIPAEQQPAPSQPETQPTPTRITLPTPAKPNTLAIISFVLSIVGIAVPGVIFGHIALRQIKRYNEPGHNWALAGLIIGYIWVALFILSFIAYIAFVILILAVAAHHGSTTGPYLDPNCLNCGRA